MAIGCNDWKTPTERRMKIISYICKRRYVTMDELGQEFGVTTRTIRSDLKDLSESYPIKTIRGRYGGGVTIHENFHLDKNYLNTDEIDILKKLKSYISTNDSVIIDSILNKFSLCR
ncbi:MAG: DeoR family transcriptional regulator [Terrisporobacter sp.]